MKYIQVTVQMPCVPTNVNGAWQEKHNKFLRGVYAPVQQELTAQECEVVGDLPTAVVGEFAQIGPNPRFAPKGRYHWYVSHTIYL